MNKAKILVIVESDLKEIVPGYIEKRKQDIPLMREALKKEDFKTLQSMGHKLKGNAGGYGFDQLGLLGAEVEAAAKTGNGLFIEEALKKMEDYFSVLEIIFE